MKIDENASNYAINRYLKAWKIPETKTYNLKPLPNSMNKKREIGEIWFENNKWYKQEEGFKIEFSLKSNIEDTKIFVRCHDCGTKFINNTQNTNNILSIKDTNCCTSCFAKKETDEIILNKRNDIINEDTIVVKDHFGRPLGTLKQLKELYTEEEYGLLLKKFKDEKIIT